MKGKKTGGRLPGSLNKRTIAIEEMLSSHNLNPVKEILTAFPDLDAEQKSQVCLKLMKFLYPEKRAVEQTFSPEALEALDTFEKFKDKPEEELLAMMNLTRLER